MKLSKLQPLPVKEYKKCNLSSDELIELQKIYDLTVEQIANEEKEYRLYKIRKGYS